MPVPIARGGLRVSNDTSASRWRRTSSSTSVISLVGVDLGPQRAAHAEQLDETLRLLNAPIRRLRIRRAGGIEDVRRPHRNRIDPATTGLEHDLAADHPLRRSEECFEVGLQRIVEEAL